MKKSSAATTQRKARFNKAHRDGMQALADGNYQKFGDAVQRERVIIEEQQRSIDEGQRSLPRPKRRPRQSS